ncbi:MAG: GNAT family N-acetyltransferase [Oscillospiraceae bacterium]|nr:GNAT family N-acetyltransferase [Oscillospiraceae bacterium]
MIEIRVIDAAHKADINIPNEPFALFGRMEPSYVDGQWGYREVLLDEKDVSEMCFPDENYDYGEMKENHVFLGAYDGERCIGLAVLRDEWFKYMYLYDLKVSGIYRGRGAALALIEKAKEVSKSRGYNGLYTQGQDNNLGACKFYIKAGFHIGGLDTNIYKGTSQEGKSDILFYIDV